MTSGATRAVLFGLLLACLCAVMAGPVHAQIEQASCDAQAVTCSGADAADGEVTFGARVVDTSHITSGEGASSDSGVSTCTFRATGPDFSRRSVYDVTDVPLWAIFYWMDCGDRSYLRWYVNTRSDPVNDGLLTEAVQAAFDTIGAEVPVMALSPSADSTQLTGMRTWLAILPSSFERIAGSVSAGEITVSAWLEPQQVVWDLGNGDTEICDGPGTTYIPALPSAAQSPACSYTYLVTPSARMAGGRDDGYRLSGRVLYQAGYRVSGPIASGEYLLGDVLGPVTETQLIVRELRAVLVGP